jgi:hypothetical protein
MVSLPQLSAGHLAASGFEFSAGKLAELSGNTRQHLIGSLGELQAKRVDFYLHQQKSRYFQAFGPRHVSDVGVFAEFERSMIVDLAKARLAREGKPPLCRATGKTQRGQDQTVGLWTHALAPRSIPLTFGWFSALDRRRRRA